jgi:hypothetical protein
VNAHPILHTLVREPRDVRHLLIHSVEDPSATTLTQLVAGVQTLIATGTEYEMHQKANMLIREWSGDGFRHPDEHAPVFESLQRTVALATAMGYRVVHDPQYVDQRKMNLTGEVLLTQWSGRTAKSGGNYEYAFDGTTIIAQPILPPNHGVDLQPATAAEFLTILRRARTLRDAFGPTVTFFLAD